MGTGPTPPACALPPEKVTRISNGICRGGVYDAIRKNSLSRNVFTKNRMVPLDEGVPRSEMSSPTTAREKPQEELVV